MGNELEIFIKNIGRTELRRRLGVTNQAITNAIDAGALPPGWFDVVETLAVEKGDGLEVPRHLFNFRAPSSLHEGEQS